MARYGGEEFVILLVETAKSGAFDIAERIRVAVEAHRFEYEDNKIRITFSIGGCDSSSIQPQAVADVVSSADRALYWAKEKGRNRSEFFNAGLYLRGRSIRNGNGRRESS